MARLTPAPAPVDGRRYPRRSMAKTLVIAEKPSVGRDLTRVLPGAFQKHEGYLESETHVVTWAQRGQVKRRTISEVSGLEGDGG